MFLSDDTVELRKLDIDDDLKNYLEMVNDVQSLPYIDGIGKYPLNKKDLKEYIETTSGLFVGIFCKNSNEHVGNINISNMSQENRRCCFGIVLHKKYRKKKYAISASRLIIKHVFERLNFHRISLYVNSPNIAAIKLYEKLGFKQEGLLRENYWLKNRYEDTYIYSLLSNEYLE